MPLRLSGSTGVSGIDGTAQAPAVQGTNPNAGIYYSGNNVIVSTSGNTALTVGPSGNVAISNSFSISGQFVTPYSGMMKNRIINGDMRIDQRFAGAANTGVTGTNQYVTDRWLCRTMIAGRTRFQQNNTNGPGQSATQIATGFSNYFGANVVSSNTSYSAGDQYYILQCIEGSNIQDLNWGSSVASPATLSFWVYSSIAGTHAGCFTNANANRSYPFTYTINTANTWQYQTITVPGDTTGSWFSNNGIGMYVIYNLGTGTTHRSSSGNSWQSSFYMSVTNAVNVQDSANGSFYLTGVQLEKGSQATAFDFRHFTTELQLCQRYYQKTYEIGTIPGSVTSTSYFVGTTIMESSTTSWGAVHRFPVEMRATPTNTPYKTDGTAGRLDYFTSGTGANSGIVTAFGASTKAIGYYHSGTASGTSGNAVVISGHIVSSAELAAQN